jgi:hypothetical protein
MKRDINPIGIHGGGLLWGDGFFLFVIPIGGNELGLIIRTVITRKKIVGVSRNGNREMIKGCLLGRKHSGLVPTFLKELDLRFLIRELYKRKQIDIGPPILRTILASDGNPLVTKENLVIIIKGNHDEVRRKWWRMLNNRGIHKKVHVIIPGNEMAVVSE